LLNWGVFTPFPYIKGGGKIYHCGSKPTMSVAASIIVTLKSPLGYRDMIGTTVT